MDRIICVFGGLLLGAAVCLSVTWGRRPMDEALARRARAYVGRIAALQDEERNAFLDRMAGDHRLQYEWRTAVLLNNEFGGPIVSLTTGRYASGSTCAQKNCAYGALNP